MVEETFEAPTPKEAYALAKAKYPHLERLELLQARQREDRDGKLSAEITVAVPEEAYLESLGMSEEEELIREIQELQDQMHRMKAAAGLTTAEDEKVQKVLSLLESKGLRREWLEAHLEPVLGTPVAADEALLLSYLLEEIDEGLEVVPEELSTPRVMMMVGPTGVGKTTTIAKLAARYSYLLDREYKVALINLDTWRAGAYEQLDNFARILHLEHRRAERIEEFAQHLDALKDYDVVLVDTAGISPYDTDRLIKTIEFLKSVQNREITTSLVISATAKYEDIREIYEHFNFIRVDNAIVTKFDETQRVGDLIAFLTEKHLPVSYISTGQKVPDDLLPASKERILEAFTGELHA
ncbi:AAA family ATPase [Nitratifractor salsuginis]|uniref:Flagellar biosynthesis protein FlhF n=1 Tax=Nitratifractor salsuginis (strain DSM 16511 / JCM 12458 / E9I37-1) TaxID=749222 RepID=E6WZ84_NITSE|nr:AAA family ATPase [Nitratifractor salsuginis]ADV46596.1 GTP-binding signal recognition particle SRP54 G- domain protein [Nitratifractor salsuginis DSM 16511]